MSSREAPSAIGDQEAQVPDVNIMQTMGPHVDTGPDMVAMANRLQQEGNRLVQEVNRHIEEADLLARMLATALAAFAPVDRGAPAMGTILTRAVTRGVALPPSPVLPILRTFAAEGPFLPVVPQEAADVHPAWAGRAAGTDSTTTKSDDNLEIA